MKFGPGLLDKTKIQISDLSQILRPINFIPESKNQHSLGGIQNEPKSHGCSCRRVGEISNVTIEDVLEEIVGEIVDETDISESEDIIQLTEMSLSSALTEIETFNYRFSSSFEATDLIIRNCLNAFGKIPLVNDSIEIQNFHYRFSRKQKTNFKIENCLRIFTR